MPVHMAEENAIEIKFDVKLAGTPMSFSFEILPFEWKFFVFVFMFVLTCALGVLAITMRKRILCHSAGDIEFV